MMSKVQIGGVLDQQCAVMLHDALNCAAKMIIEKRFGRRTLIVPETVDRLCSCPCVTCQRRAHSGFGAEGFYDIYQIDIKRLSPKSAECSSSSARLCSAIDLFAYDVLHARIS